MLLFLVRFDVEYLENPFLSTDPFMRKRNVARSLSHSQVYEYIDERLRCAYKYFGIVPNGKLEFSFDDPILIPKKVTS